MKKSIYIDKFIRLTFSEKIVFVYGLLLSTIFLLIIKLLPAKCYFHLLKSGKINNEINKDHVRIALSAVRRIGKVSESFKNCLIKSFTLKYILKIYSINSDIILSVNNSGEKVLQAHAYLEINNDFSVFKLRSYNDLY